MNEQNPLINRQISRWGLRASEEDKYVLIRIAKDFPNTIPGQVSLIMSKRLYYQTILSGNTYGKDECGSNAVSTVSAVRGACIGKKFWHDCGDFCPRGHRFHWVTEIPVTPKPH